MKERSLSVNTFFSPFANFRREPAIRLFSRAWAGRMDTLRKLHGLRRILRSARPLHRPPEGILKHLVTIFPHHDDRRMSARLRLALDTRRAAGLDLGQGGQKKRR